MGDVVRNQGHASGMAGEFFILERLFRLGCEPTLSLGNAKKIDILVEPKSQIGRVKKISVKTIKSKTKWPIIKIKDELLLTDESLFIALVYYHDFSDLKTDPFVWIVPANKIKDMSESWFEYLAINYKRKLDQLEVYANAWHLISM